MQQIGTDNKRISLKLKKKLLLDYFKANYYYLQKECDKKMQKRFLSQSH